jgi:uncharacterized metal-binding protein (TIGR02443 family)
MNPEDGSPKSPPSRRFIAGAVCPRCSAMDTILVDRETDLRECVACGFTDPRPKDKLAAATEPSTRVSRPAARRVETAAEVVRFLEPPPRDGSKE